MVRQEELGCGWSRVISPAALDEDLATATDPRPPGTFTSTQHSDEWKIKNALSAGPPWITDNATVVEMGVTMSGGKHKMTERVIRPGTNGWKCMPDFPGLPQHDRCCADETTMKRMTAVMEGRKPNIHRSGLSYPTLALTHDGQHSPPTQDPSAHDIP